MKVLVFTPIAGLDAEAVQSAFTQVWDGPLGIYYLRDNPHRDGRENVLRAYLAARAVCLAGDYDAMLTLESDMVVPPDTLAKLAAVEAPVVHALYTFRSRGQPWNLLVGHKWPGTYMLSPETRRLVWGKVVKAQGVGFGCTLIHRSALEAIPFRNGADAHCDWYFAEDCHAAGVEVRVHCGAAVGHKGRDGVVWWPTADGTARATKPGAGEVYAYIGQGDYIAGFPARDLTPEEWARQPAELRALAESLDVSRHVKPGPGDGTLEERYRPCQK